MECVFVMRIGCVVAPGIERTRQITLAYILQGAIFNPQDNSCIMGCISLTSILAMSKCDPTGIYSALDPSMTNAN